MRHAVTDEQIREIVRLRAQGIINIEIGRRVGLSETAVSLYVKEPEHPKAKAVLALIASGTRKGAAGKAHGLTPSQVSEIVARDRALRIAANGSTPHVEPEAIVEPEVAVEPEPTEAETASLRTRLLKAIVESGPFVTMEDLMKFVRRPNDPYDTFGAHEVNHILMAGLSRDGLIRLSDRGHGAARAVRNIRATPAGRRAMGYPTVTSHRKIATEPTAHGIRAKGGPVTKTMVQHIHQHDKFVWQADCYACKVYHPDGESHDIGETSSPAEVTATDAPNAYPILADLRARVVSKAKAAQSSARYLEAAALLEGINDAERDHLLQLAEAAEGAPFMQIESEFLRYAEAHPE